nr:DUF1080 domain-containing protein [Kofleriaceae bacterium]
MKGIVAIVVVVAACRLVGAVPGEVPPPRDQPRVVTPGAASSDPPSDATVLFHGGSGDLASWRASDGGVAPWLADGSDLVVAPGTGDLYTRAAFGSCQLHVEFATPAVVHGDGQDRGNSGVYLMGLYEIQVLDSYRNETYAHGGAGAVYKQHAPLVNASRPPGQWQSYDIIFHAPAFDADGKLVARATVTLLHDGVLVQDHVELMGVTSHDQAPYYQAHAARLPLRLQDHGAPVRYRNLWIRDL